MYFRFQEERVCSGYQLERLHFLTVVRDPWLIENGFLTPTMKMKRSKLEDTYGPKADDWYAAGCRIVWED